MLTTFNILSMITEQKPCERQILINVWPVQTLFVNFDVVQLLWRCVFKSPIPSDWETQRPAIWKRNMKKVIGKKHCFSISQSIHAICSLWFPCLEARKYWHSHTINNRRLCCQSKGHFIISYCFNASYYIIISDSRVAKSPPPQLPHTRQASLSCFASLIYPKNRSWVSRAESQRMSKSLRLSVSARDITLETRVNCDV